MKGYVPTEVIVYKGFKIDIIVLGKSGVSPNSVCVELFYNSIFRSRQWYYTHESAIIGARKVVDVFTE